MPVDHLALPWFTNTWKVVGLFLLFLCVCHVVLIRWRPIGSIAWKKVDYVWLSMAFIGILGSIGNGRGIVANNMLKLEMGWLESSRSYVESMANDGTSPSICRKFIPSTLFSPKELAQVQGEFDAQCRWFREAYSTIKNLPKTVTKISATTLLAPYPSGGDQSHFKFLSDAIVAYNANVERVIELQNEAKENQFETILRLLGPAVVALALALRITKVTAEIISERAKS